LWTCFFSVFWVVRHWLVLKRPLESLACIYFVRLTFSYFCFSLFLKFELDGFSSILIKAIEKFIICLRLTTFGYIWIDLIFSHGSCNTVSHFLFFWFDKLTFFLIIKYIVDHCTYYRLCPFQIISNSHIIRVLARFKSNQFSWFCT